MAQKRENEGKALEHPLARYGGDTREKHLEKAGFGAKERESIETAARQMTEPIKLDRDDGKRMSKAEKERFKAASERASQIIAEKELQA
jgi:hypothetical protein